ncbi:CDP-alcohol phosphatidyltransferase family protein [Lentzea sp. NPDC058436]|uniref:CDP-alcohol phosphatidyltransferase family protein n=1 Tax=Lentzea sp. NPDC058436 TaxID=3346499 RepID=UPI00364E7FA2
MRDPADRLLTIPNLLSVLRLAGVPLFLYLLLGPRADGWALLVLVFAGLSDWLDGKLARWLNQMSNLGALLDPAADRLYVFCTLLAFVIRDIVPLWVALVLVGREVVVGICLLVLRQRGWGTFEVTYLGKAATFNLLYAFPLLLLAQGDSGWAQVALPFAYAFTAWGGALYLWSALLYVYQFFLALRTTPRTVA